MHGVDLTPTDHVAAMLLLRQAQHAGRRGHAQDRLADAGATPGEQRMLRCVKLKKVSAPL